MITSAEEKEFDRLVPHGEAAFVVLRAQLISEHSVAQYVAARVPALAVELADRNSPVRSGLALILLAQSLSLCDEIPPTCSDILWPALKKLNSLRNSLAHQLYPEEAKSWLDDPFNYDVPNGENINRVYKRVKEFLDEVSKLNENIVIVTHEGIIRLACCWVFDDPSLFFKFKADNGSINIVTVNDDFKYISKLNQK